MSISKLRDLAFHFVAGLRHSMNNRTACCSFVSVIHLLVGVVYCLVSWTVGLPKRAVISTSFHCDVISLTALAVVVVNIETKMELHNPSFMHQKKLKHFFLNYQFLLIEDNASNVEITNKLTKKNLVFL